ncbi:MAG: type II secretion system protein [Lentisphaeraceae bacterium]|nr:type II secretion system protein [Lentisphaeraceae bacterium]
MSKRKKIHFTLIELLVVIAIIGILLTMLLPSISRAKKTAQVAVCSSNQGQLFKSGMLYANNNDGRIVPGAISPSISYDDLLAPYMGRNLTASEINMGWFDKEVAVLKCPSSTIEKTTGNWKTPDVPGITRSYSMNSSWGWGNDKYPATKEKPPTGITSERGGFSFKLSQLLDSGNLLYSGERHTIKNAVGYGSNTVMERMREQDLGVPAHSGLRSVYVLADGHAEAMILPLAQSKRNRK